MFGGRLFKTIGGDMRDEKLQLALRINSAMWLMHGICPIPIYHIERFSRSFLREWWADMVSMCWYDSVAKDWKPLHIPSWIPDAAMKMAANWKNI